MDRHGTHGQQTIPRGRPVSGVDAAHANEFFEHFINATSLKNILGYYRSLCDHLHLRPNVFPLFYPKLKANLTSWKAKALWKKFDARASHKCYGKGKLCSNTRVLIIGAGPCGLRSAIEAQLLGAKVVVIEKRDRLSRNNVLHLWPFVIEDLRFLGAKKFFGKFCAGAIDHISIRQLQCILFKVALLIGVEIHTEVSFEHLIEPNAEEKTGWRAEFKPHDHPVSQYEFDVILGADGKRNTLQGFKRKEFRGKLAIAITANFINKKTEAEAIVEEISGVAFIFNQKFFKDLYEKTGIDLENIVYYKDDTHYFVMTAKKPSLIEKGVILQDLADTERLLASENVNREALMNYAREAADFSTKYQLPDLEFAVNHYGLADVAMFDFTSMYAADNASKVLERNGYRLLMILVGDSLLEPFWPTGSGCARGFLSSMDAAWAIKSWSSGVSPLDVLAERESIYRLLAQTTPDNLNKDCKAYTLDPSTRYPNLNRNVLMPHQVISLYDTDNPKNIERMRRNSQEAIEIPKKRRRGNVDSEILLSWMSDQVRAFEDIQLTDVASVFRGGKALCAILHHYRPDLLDYSAIKDDPPNKNNQLAIDLLEKELGIPPIMTGEEITNNEDYLSMATYLTQIYDTFRCEIPHIKLPKLELPENKQSAVSLKSIKTAQPHMVQGTSHVQQQSRPSSRHKRHADAMSQSKVGSMDRKTRKRRTLEKVGASVEERQRTLEEIVANRYERQNKRRQQRKLQTEQFLKSMQMLHANAKLDKSLPFEDYSIYLYRQTAPNFEDRVKDLEKQFTYVPDHENKLPNQTRGNADEVAARIKNLEEKWREPPPVEKKPKDLLRAIGKIETSDWNIKEIEKKIMENKLGKPANKDKEKVPKWSKEQFLARQTKMEKQHLDRQDSAEAKFADIDKNIRHLEMKLKEGTSRDLGQNKVASITEKLVSKNPDEPKPIQKTNVRPVILPSQNASEFCHFCNKRVYLMERLSAEGRFFHHGCFKCQYCNTQLRLGSYSFDKDGFYGHKFFCLHHYGMQAEPSATKVTRKPSQHGIRDAKSPEKRQIRVTGLDLLDRVQTPERIEFANLSTGQASSDHEDSLSQMDEDEWTDRNFGASTAEFGSSDDESSSLSDSDSDDEDAFEEAMDEPATKEGTMKWAELFKKRYSRKGHGNDSDGYSSSDHSSYYENTSDDDESDTATEGEEEIRARELRKQEVRVEPPVVQTDTGTDTEVVSDESSSSASEIQNSATEISTDSEFAQDDPTPTREIPAIVLNDFHVTKTRGSGQPRKLQVTSGFIQSPSTGKALKQDIELKLTPLVPSARPIIKQPAPKLLPRTEGYALNRTQSTGGIAAKVSLELKKRYLLGESVVPGNIQKSGSASIIDSKMKSFHSNISDCQKLLKPAPEISASMKTFCNKLDEQRVSPILSPQSPLNVSKQFGDKENEIGQIILPPPDVTKVEVRESKEPKVFENECEGRPRSPVHERSIIVPKIDWSMKKVSRPGDSLSECSNEDLDHKQSVFNQDKIPSVKIHPAEDMHDTNDDIPPDSLCIEAELKAAKDYCMENIASIISEPPKSIASEKKSLNQPKALPELDHGSMLPEIHTSLHMKLEKREQKRPLTNDKQSPEESKSLKNSSGRSTPDSCAEQVTNALTETELSDWARDEDVSDVEFEFTHDLSLYNRTSKQPKNLPVMKSDAGFAEIGEFDDMGHICNNKDKSGREMKGFKNKTIITEAMNSLLSSNLDNIEFMDTGTETSSDEGLVDATNGYMLFRNEDDIQEDSLNPSINIEFVRSKYDRPFNTGYCVYDEGHNNFGSKVIDLKPSDLEKMKHKQSNYEHEDDSLLVVDTGTTTEENTCSDSTVKNVTEMVLEKEEQKPPAIELDNLDEEKNEEPLEQKMETETEEVVEKLDNKSALIEEKSPDSNNLEFQAHCQRLQSKVEFGNVKDSIDIRKSRRKSKSETQKPDLIQEEKEKCTPPDSPKEITLKLSPVVRTPDALYNKKFIEKERDINQKLVQEMVMNKMKAENKSLERRRRNRNSGISSTTVLKPFDLTKSATADRVSYESSAGSPSTTPTNRLSEYSTNSRNYAPPDVLLSTNSVPLQKSQTFSIGLNLGQSSEENNINTSPKSPKEQIVRPLSVYSTFSEKGGKNKELSLETILNAKNGSEPDIKKEHLNKEFKTPIAPPRQRNEEAKKTAEKMKQEARARVRLLSNEELGLSPEDKLIRLKEKVAKQHREKQKNKENECVDVLMQKSVEPLTMNAEKRTSWLYANDTLKKKKNNSFKRSKSGDDTSNPNIQSTRLRSSDNVSGNEVVKPQKLDAIKMCRSDPNLLDTDCKKAKKKSKDGDRKKSITTILSGLFSSKKSPGSGSKGLFSRISPKSKGLSKSCTILELRDPVVHDGSVRRKSFSETSRRKVSRETPPPVPPLPLNYSGCSHKDDSSDGEHDWAQNRSSCDTLDQSGTGTLDYSTASGRRSSKGLRKAARQAQSKRHRMAQQIQRKLEEIEVKTRDLEQQGVLLEKALRGEAEQDLHKDESELLQEWFDLMRERTELRRYEKELMIRAQELELEDRHARLQHDLRERIENDDKKTQEDKQIERSIINEMMEIVDKRDSLIALLEEDRLRYSNEDRDFEERMLAKGLKLTPIRKTPEK